MFKRWFAGKGLTFTFALLGLVLFLFIVVPLLKMVFASDPGTMWDTLFDSAVLNSIWLTVYAALIASLCGFIFGVPLAYFLARHDFPGKRVVESLIDVPIVVPHSAVGIALLFVFGRNFLMGSAFENIGIGFLDSLAGIVIAMLFVSVPFLIDSARTGFQKVDVRMENVSRTLGASPWQTFARVSFPLAGRDIMAGGIMMWARGISEFGAVVILAYHPMIAPVLVWERFQSGGLEAAQPVAAILIIICLIVFVILRTLVFRRKRHDKR